MAGPDSTSLAASRVAGDDQAERHLVMLHGIYGRGRNWQGIARTLVAARPEYACWLVDLPYHGDSGPGAHGDTVDGLAGDVADWMDGTGLAPTAVLGHSFGGKVALALAGRWASRPLQVWVIDSTPEVKTPSGSAWEMLEVVASLPRQFESRQQAQAALEERGYPLGVAQWMTTNLQRDGDSFRWQLDFGAMERLLRNFFDTDLWSVVEQAPAQHQIHVLKASESSAVSPAAVARLEAAAGDRVKIHHRKGGHWIHAESPGIVTELLIEHLPRP